MFLRPPAEVPYPGHVKMSVRNVHVRSIRRTRYLEELLCLAEGIDSNRPLKISVPRLVEQDR